MAGSEEGSSLGQGGGVQVWVVGGGTRLVEMAFRKAIKGQNRRVHRRREDARVGGHDGVGGGDDGEVDENRWL